MDHCKSKWKLCFTSNCNWWLKQLKIDQSTLSPSSFLTTTLTTKLQYYNHHLHHHHHPHNPQPFQLIFLANFLKRRMGSFVISMLKCMAESMVKSTVTNFLLFYNLIPERLIVLRTVIKSLSKQKTMMYVLMMKVLSWLVHDCVLLAPEPVSGSVRLREWDMIRGPASTTTTLSLIHHQPSHQPGHWLYI